MKITEKQISDKGGKVYTTKIINRILEKQNLGLPLRRDEKIWFNNQTGVRKSGMAFAMTNEELDEYMKCKLSVHYFAEKMCSIKREDGSIGPLTLRDYQKKILNLYSDNRYSVLMASRQLGKEQDMDSIVWNENGKMRFGDLKPGDRIYGADGELTTVVEIHHQGIKDIYEIEFSDGTTVRCGEDHLWEVEKWKKTKVIPFYEIKEKYLTDRGDSIYYVKVAEPVNYPQRNLKIDPYFMGLILGDGSTRNKRLTISTNDEEIINFLYTLEDDRIKVVKEKDTVDYYIRKRNSGDINNKYVTLLKEYGMMEKYSYEKFIPSDYLYTSIEQRLELLRGLMDTDGFISEGCPCYATTSKQLSDDVRELCHSLGIRTAIREKDTSFVYKGEKKNGRKCYIVRLYLKNDYKYPIFKLTRKQSQIRNKKFDWGQKRGIVNIKHVGKKEAQCIVVDSPTSLYLTDNYIPTHNTVSAAIMILHFVLFNDNKNVMIVANRGETTREIIDKISKIYMYLPFFIKRGVLNWNQTSITMDNGSRIRTANRTKDPAVGFTIDLLYLDEFAKVPDNIIRPYFTTVVPTVSSIQNSKIIITSTPDGFNLFYEILRDAERGPEDPLWNGFAPMRIYWWEKKGRRDTKIKPIKSKLEKYGIDWNDVLQYLKDLNFDMYQEKEDHVVYDMIRWKEEEDHTDIDEIRKLRYERDIDVGDSNIKIIPLAEICLITNWQEEQTNLIGGRDAFSQEYDLQFITGNKLLLDNVQIEKLIKAQVDFRHIQIPMFDKRLAFAYDNLKFIENTELFKIEDAKNYHIVAGIDLSEGLGQDYTIMSIFRLLPKDKDTINKYRHTFQNMYDFFKLEQIATFSSNIYSITEVAHLFYLIFFELFDPEKVKVSLEYNTYGQSFLATLPNVFNQVNDYSNSIFYRFKHKADDIASKIGLKITGGATQQGSKKLLIKDFQTAIRRSSIVVHDGDTVAELQVFSKKETPSGDVTYQSETGHDDRVMSIVNVSASLNLASFKDFVDGYIQYNLENDYKILIDEFNTSIEGGGSAVNLGSFKTGYSQIYKKNNNNIISNPFTRSAPTPKSPFGRY